MFDDDQSHEYFPAAVSCRKVHSSSILQTDTLTSIKNCIMPSSEAPEEGKPNREGGHFTKSDQKAMNDSFVQYFVISTVILL